jgi:quercetin dioxygenase-like cupin family protein
MTSVTKSLAAVVFAAAVFATVALQADEVPGFVNLAPDELEFRPMPGNPGASFATLKGDPSEAGPYVMRYRVPAGQLVPPHYHDQDRHITVMAGTWAFGTGESYDCDDTVPMPPGSYVFHPRGAVHFDGSCTDEPIEVQIIGMGPVETFWLNETP